MSLPTRERELKRAMHAYSLGCTWSLPTRERELKPVVAGPRGQGPKSLPTRERELKHCLKKKGGCSTWVAPHAGA